MQNICWVVSYLSEGTPAADMNWSEEAMHECFNMCTMSPQLQSLIGGYGHDWKIKVRKFAEQFDTVLINPY